MDKFNLKRGITLVELILSIIFLGVIILAAVTFDYTSMFLFDSSQKKASILNEMALALEHIAKHAALATGDNTGSADSNGIVVVNSNKCVNIRIDDHDPDSLVSPPTPSDYSDDKWVRYRYKNQGGNVYSLDFCSDGENTASPVKCNVNWYTITSRIVANGSNPIPQFYAGPDPNVNELICSPFTLRYKTGNVNLMDVRKNPEVHMYDNVLFSSVSYSIN